MGFIEVWEATYLYCHVIGQHVDQHAAEIPIRHVTPILHAQSFPLTQINTQLGFGGALVEAIKPPGPLKDHLLGASLIVEVEAPPQLEAIILFPTDQTETLLVNMLGDVVANKCSTLCGEPWQVQVCTVDIVDVPLDLEGHWLTMLLDKLQQSGPKAVA